MVTSRWQRSDVLRGSTYDERFERLAAAGHDVHGEASFVMGHAPSTVLDAGCGTGRVGIELHRRGVDVVGVALDRSMLETACEKAPDLEWFRADLSTLLLTGEHGEIRRFDLVLAAGNVMIFLDPGSEAATVRCLGRHLVPGGLFVAGFQLAPDRYGIDEFERDCAAAGLEMVERFSTWSRDPWTISSGYVVSVHQSPLPLPVDEASGADPSPDASAPDGPEEPGPEVAGVGEPLPSAGTEPPVERRIT